MQFLCEFKVQAASVGGSSDVPSLEPVAWRQCGGRYPRVNTGPSSGYWTRSHHGGSLVTHIIIIF